MTPRISVFPKCYFDALCRGEMDYVAWIRSAATLGSEGLEHYDGFFRSVRDNDVNPHHRHGRNRSGPPMLCFSPDFTHPDAAERARQSTVRGPQSISP